MLAPHPDQDRLTAAVAAAAAPAIAAAAAPGTAAAAAVWTCSQPFYHLLVEVSDWGYDASQPPVAYVAQELLAAPEVEDDGATWAQVGYIMVYGSVCYT